MRRIIELENYVAKIDLAEFFEAMPTEQKREFIRKLGIQQDVIRMVTDFICGEDEESWWSSDEPQQRQNILERIESSQIKDIAKIGPRYGWSVWSDLQHELKKIASKREIYWALHHSQDPWTKENAHWFFKNNNIESDYTTKQADEDIARLFALVKDTFTRMTHPVQEQ